MAGRRRLPHLIPAPAYRGQHASTQRPWGDLGQRTRLTLVVAGVTAFGLVATLAVLTATGDNASRSSPPVPAQPSPLPIGPVPDPRPSGPPGCPSAMPTASASGRVPPPAATWPAPPPPAQPPVTAPPVTPVSYEAESAVNVLTGEARIRAVPGASGGEVIERVGGDPGNSLRFNRVTVPFAGVYSLAVRYLSAGDRSALVSVNDGRFVTVRFPATGDWQTVGSLVLRIRLDKGANSIQFGNPVDYAPDLDRIIVSA